MLRPSGFSTAPRCIWVVDEYGKQRAGCSLGQRLANAFMFPSLPP
jgi:hypothetical protein